VNKAKPEALQYGFVGPLRALCGTYTAIALSESAEFALFSKEVSA
jgi:hypothetical protein